MYQSGRVGSIKAINGILKFLPSCSIPSVMFRCPVPLVSFVNRNLAIPFGIMFCMFVLNYLRLIQTLCGKLFVSCYESTNVAQHCTHASHYYVIITRRFKNQHQVLMCYRNDNILFLLFFVYVDVKMLAKSISMFILSVLCIRKLGRVKVSIAPMRLRILLIDLLQAIEGLIVIIQTEYAARVISLC